MPELTIERVADDLLARFLQADRKETPDGWNIVIPVIPESEVVIPHAGRHFMRAVVTLVSEPKIGYKIEAFLVREEGGNDVGFFVSGGDVSDLAGTPNAPQKAANGLMESLNISFFMALSVGRFMHRSLVGASRKSVDAGIIKYFRELCTREHRGLNRPLAEINAITDRLFATSTGKTNGSYLELFVWASEVAAHHADPPVKAMLLYWLEDVMMMSAQLPAQITADSVLDIPARYLI